MTTQVPQAAAAATAVVKPRRPRRAPSRFAGIVPAILLALAVLVICEVLVRVFDLPEFVMPAPSAVFEVLFTQQAALFAATLVTAEEVAYGFFMSAIVGALVALVIARFDRFGRALYPLVVLFQTVPKIALAPLFILWFGYNLAPKVSLIVVMAFFPVALNMLVGLQSVDPNLVALLRSVGASRWDILRRVQIPHSLPYLMAGLKVAVTLGVIGAIVGEFAGASAGLGYMIQFASTQMQTSLVFAALIQVSVLGLIFYYLVELAERHYIDWIPRPNGA